jgi:hypothetical protein
MGLSLLKSDLNLYLINKTHLILEIQLNLYLGAIFLNAMIKIKFRVFFKKNQISP